MALDRDAHVIPSCYLLCKVFLNGKQIDAIALDFTKAFDKVLQTKILISAEAKKLLYHFNSLDYIQHINLVIGFIC